MKLLLSKFRANLPFLVIGLVFAWAVCSVASRRHPSSNDDRTIIRIAHWQLEAGVREGIAEAAKEYEKRVPFVRIVQEAIPETTYGQWMSTQMMGGTAPDIVQAGMVEGHLMTAFFTRYFLPLSQYVTKPNPYNRGTDLENTPLLLTYKDGMRRSFVDETQEYMTIPLALTSVRVFYNKTVLKQLTGLDEAPRNFREFLKVCNQIRSAKQKNGQPYIALAGSRYHYSRWEEAMAKPLTYGALQKIDFNRDGRFSKEEMFLGFLSHKVSFEEPNYRANLEMVRDLTAQFPGGWFGLSRDEALFNFAQQKAVFIATGTWEAEGIREQAQDKFDLGIMDFPLPSPEDPQYGTVLQGPRYEIPDGSMPMAVSRSCKYPEIAVDFLLFLASRENNQKFNERLKWIPIIRGAKTDPYLANFEPKLEGVIPAFDPSLGGESTIRWSQLYSLFQINQLSQEDLGKQFADFYTSKGKEDFAETLRNRARAQLQDEHLGVGLRIRAMYEPQNQPANWYKYRTVMVTRQIGGDETILNQQKWMRNPEAAGETLLYQYTPAALDQIRRNLAKEHAHE